MGELRDNALLKRDMEFASALLRRLTPVSDDLEDQLRNESAFVAAVIAYARSFTTTRGASTYPLRGLKKREGFDRAIHDHLLEMRNRLIAHADADAFPVEAMIHQVEMSSDVSQVFGVRLTTAVHGFGEFTDSGFVERLANHLHACWQEADEKYNDAARKDLTEFNQSESTIARGKAVDPSAPFTEFNLAYGDVVFEFPAQLDQLTSWPNVRFHEQYKFLMHPIVYQVKDVTVLHEGKELVVDIKTSLVDAPVSEA